MGILWMIYCEYFDKIDSVMMGIFDDTQLQPSNICSWCWKSNLVWLHEKDGIAMTQACANQVNMQNPYIVSTVPADALAPNSARPSAVIVVITKII